MTNPFLDSIIIFLVFLSSYSIIFVYFSSVVFGREVLLLVLHLLAPWLSLQSLSHKRSRIRHLRGIDDIILLENYTMKTRFLLINLHSFALRFPINVAWPLLKSTSLFFCCFFFLLSLLLLFGTWEGGVVVSLFFCLFLPKFDF